jgi:CRP-like cAMP-binding protein
MDFERTAVVRVRQQDKINALGRIPLFSELSKKELVFLARMTTEVDVREGSTLVRQGEMGREAMIIESGTAVVSRNNRKIDDLGPGDFFGEMSLIDHMPRNADVVATSDMTVLVMDSREFSTVLDTYPKVAVKILKTVVERLVEAQSTPI